MADSKTKFGFNTWKIESYEPFVFLDKYTVTIPKGYTLYANGTAVSEKYITEISVNSEYPKINGTESPSFIRSFLLYNI